MRNKLLTFVILLFLAGCVNTPEPLSYREQLDVYKDMKIRLFKMASPVKVSGVGVCAKTGTDTGVLTHSLSDYPHKMRDVAQSYWSLTDEDTVLYENASYNVLNCQAPLVLVYDAIPNAYTDGESIYITPVLLSKVDDLALALIIAHELGHIVLKHVDAEPSEALERAADRFALFMLARVGLDYRKAALQEVASRQLHMSGGQTYLDTTKRADYFRKVVAEIERLQADGKALVP